LDIGTYAWTDTPAGIAPSDAGLRAKRDDDVCAGGDRAVHERPQDRHLVVADRAEREIAIGDDPDQRTMRIDGTHAAKSLARHLDERQRHRRRFFDERHFRIAVHEIGHAQQALAQFTTGMQLVEILGREALARQGLRCR
jgi:hypothetical protein